MKHSDQMTKDKSSEIHRGEIIVKIGDCEKLLGTKIFDEHVKQLTENCEYYLQKLLIPF